MGPYRSLCALVLCAFLALGCGGGGGGGGNGAQGNSWLSLTPSPVTVTTVAGVSAPFTITATSSKTISQTLFPVFVDNLGVLDPNSISITAQSQLQYKGTFATSKTLAQGSYQGSFSLWLYTDSQHTSAYPGSPWTIPYQITVGPVRVAHKLLPNALGAAFSSTPAGSRLTKSILVADNLGRTIPWQADSNQPWLSVTGTGTTGSPGTTLILTADPTGLPMDTISYATVTLTSSDTSVQPVDKIQVGIWKGSTSPQRTDVATGFPTSQNMSNACYPSICADPVRPYVYFTYGSNIIDCYNVYTASKVASIKFDDGYPALPPAGYGPAAGSMTIAPDGSKLYVGDSIGIYARIFSLPGMTLIGAIPYFRSSLTYARPNGVGIILSSAGDAILASTNTRLSYNGPVGMATTADSGSFFAVSDYLGQGVISRYSMDCSEYGGGTLVTKLLNQNSYSSGDFWQIAVSQDGTRPYVITHSQQLARLDPVALSVLTTFPFNAATICLQVRVGGDGRAYYSTQNYNTGQFGITILGSDDSLVSTLVANPQTLPLGIESYDGLYGFDVSADSMVLVANANRVVQFFPMFP